MVSRDKFLQVAHNYWGLMINPKNSSEEPVLLEAHLIRKMKGASICPSAVTPHWSKVVSGALAPLPFWFVHM